MAITYNAPSGAVAAQNGLSAVNGKVELGGELLHDTYVDLKGKILNFGHAVGSSGTLQYDGVQVATVDDITGSTASNGLHASGNDIRLGGVLDGFTSIDTALEALLIGAISQGVLLAINLSQIISTVPNGAGDYYFNGVSSGPSGNGYFAGTTDNLTKESSVKIMQTAMQIKDTYNEKGFVYADDYTTNQLLDDRAITDVGGVKKLITIATGFVWP
jgi:hypothetical protein